MAENRNDANRTIQDIIEYNLRTITDTQAFRHTNTHLHIDTHIYVCFVEHTNTFLLNQKATAAATKKKTVLYISEI